MPEESNPLGAAAARLAAAKDEIFAEWRRRLAAAVAKSRPLSTPTIIDTPPAFIDNLIAALQANAPHLLEAHASTIAQEHGGERARLTNFTAEDLVREYRLLGDVLYDALGDRLTKPIERLLRDALDSALVQALGAFHLEQQKFREQYTYTLGHDLRTPLSAIKATAFLIARTQDAARHANWAGRILDNVERIERMIQDLLDAAQIESGARPALTLEPVEAYALVRDALAQLAGVHGDRFALEGTPPIECQWNADQIRRAVENLAVNGIKYGAPAGVVHVSLWQGYGRVIIAVHNEGPPIPPEDQASLFQLFRRAKDSPGRGWGLGLAQVRAAAEAHGGSIGLKSTKEHGTTFLLDLPQDARPFQSSRREAGGPG